LDVKELEKNTMVNEVYFLVLGNSDKTTTLSLIRLGFPKEEKEFFRDTFFSNAWC
jgi:hypothetical protein